MRTLHTNVSQNLVKSESRLSCIHKICGAVRFIPNRPNEILSAGYDSAMLHFDITRRTVLSRFDIGRESAVGRVALLIQHPLAGLPPSSEVSLSPPFIHCIALSEYGAVAASTADDRVWVGRGGDKSIASKKRRHRKWEGLREDEGNWVLVAEGPVVSVCVDNVHQPIYNPIKSSNRRNFAGSENLVVCTLLGSLSRYDVGVGSTEAEMIWSRHVEQLAKVNCMRSNEKYVVVGGFSNDGKGLVEVYGE